ncbi:trans-aconitate 2-methyltransferase [Priestia aryabhattai]|uniref:class I SAM-dependent methyltransferase n=1 Tax=Priestia aryabhattai TaxID=412384 RepID=UPI0039A0C6F8
MKNNVKEKFNTHASQYDEQRRKLIPCFFDFYSIPVSLLHFSKKPLRVLDIGAGTGLFSSFVKEKYPDAHFTLIDVSDQMLEKAKQRFKNEQHMEFIVSDITSYEFEHSFDIVISSLAIHHLEDEQKQKLYGQIFDLLHAGGIFINADQVLGHSSLIEELYKKDWSERIASSGLTHEQIEAAYERTKLDKMATLHDQLNWLTSSGFSTVDCIYKFFNFVVMYAQK